MYGVASKKNQKCQNKVDLNLETSEIVEYCYINELIKIMCYVLKIMSGLA
jgi:hypothetical protein